MAEVEENRFDRILKLNPCRFHISDNPPFAAGLTLCGTVNGEEEDGEQFFTQLSGIRSWKPGIWTSIRSIIPNPFPDAPHFEHGVECFLR